MTARFLILILALATPAAAQTVSLEPVDAPRWDVSGSIGWLSGNKGEIAEEWNDWYDTFAASVEAGRYWTPHLKTELGGVFTTEGTFHSQQQFVVPGRPFPIFSQREHHVRVDALSASATYQFLQNTWVHPFLTAGVQLGRERERSFSRYPFGRGREPEPVPLPVDQPRETTSVVAMPFVGGGLKFYVSERAFIRTDFNVGVHAGEPARMLWRVGVGTDF